MKLAAVKIGARIAWGNKDTSAGSGEAKSIINMLRLGGAQVDIYTKVLPKDQNPDTYEFFNIDDEWVNINSRGYEGLVVINGNLNFFGGAEDLAGILIWRMINLFKGRVFYVYCDGMIPLRQVWPSIAGKPWASNWKQEEIEIRRTDIVYVSQPYDLVAAGEIIAKASVPVEAIEHYPTEKFPCLNGVIPMNPNPTWDLSYGGTMRGGKRIKKMAKYYFNYGKGLRVEMFGKIDLEPIHKEAKKQYGSEVTIPVINPPVNWIEFEQKMNDTLAHVVIGDIWYEGRHITQRTYESIFANVVTFVDTDFDPQRRVFGTTGFCSEFNYVSSQQEVEAKLLKVKEDPNFRGFVLKEQFKAVGFDADSYCKGYYDIFKKWKSEPILEGEPIPFEKVKTKEFNQEMFTDNMIKARVKETNWVKPSPTRLQSIKEDKKGAVPLF